MSNEILVIGGTGKTGRRVAERLTNLNVPVRIGSRNAAIPFDWDNEITWLAALQDIKKAYITFPPDLAVPGSSEKIALLVQAAKEAGVQKLVLLSGRGEEEAQLCERKVIESGLDYTIVRASWFMQNFSEGYFLESILAGHFVLPKINALEPFTDADDIADVVVASLINDEHSKKIYELTGPELLSFKEATFLISSAINRPIVYEEINMEEYRALLKSYELPEDIIWLITYLFSEVLDGRNESVTNDVEKVLARKPTSFKSYAEKTIKTGIWNNTK